MFLALLAFHFVSCRHNMSTFLSSIISFSSLTLSVIVPIFKVPTLTSECLSFHTTRGLFTRLPPLVFTMFSIAQFLQVPCCATPEAVVGNPGRNQSGMDLSTIRICTLWQKSFTPDALPAATLPIYPCLRPATRNTRMCLR